MIKAKRATIQGVTEVLLQLFIWTVSLRPDLLSSIRVMVTKAIALRATVLGAGYGIISGWSEFQVGTHSAIYAHHGAWLDISGSMVWDTSGESSTTTIGKIVLVDNPGVHIHGNYITRGRSPGILATANQSLFSNNELHVRYWVVAPTTERIKPVWRSITLTMYSCGVSRATDL